MNYGVEKIKADYWAYTPKNSGGAIFEKGRGPEFFLCIFCGLARSRDFSCECLPDFVTYCWECRLHNCEHTEKLIRDWDQKRGIDAS